MILYANKPEDVRAGIDLYGNRPKRRREKDSVTGQTRVFLRMDGEPLFTVYPDHGAFYKKFDTAIRKTNVFYQVVVKIKEVKKIVTKRTQKVVTA